MKFGKFIKVQLTISQVYFGTNSSVMFPFTFTTFFQTSGRVENDFTNHDLFSMSILTLESSLLYRAFLFVGHPSLMPLLRSFDSNKLKKFSHPQNLIITWEKIRFPSGNNAATQGCANWHEHRFLCIFLFRVRVWAFLPFFPSGTWIL